MTDDAAEAIAVYQNGTVRRDRGRRPRLGRMVDKGSGWLTAVLVVGVAVAIVLGATNAHSTNEAVGQIHQVVGSIQETIHNHSTTLNAINSATQAIKGEDKDIRTLVSQIKSEQTLQTQGNTTVGHILKEAGAAVVVLEGSEGQSLVILKKLCAATAGCQFTP
jgi:predicted PurR-regulated permease PerM